MKHTAQGNTVPLLTQSILESRPLNCSRVDPLLLSVCFLFKGLSFVPVPGVTRTEDARLGPFGTVMLRLGAEALCRVRRG